MTGSILMTGGAGCIGSWVAKLLLEDDRPVTILDLKPDTRRLSWIVDDPKIISKVKFVQGDVADVETVIAAAEGCGAEAILHLAGLQVPVCRADPLMGARVNVLGTLAVFEAARRSQGRIGRVVYASSAAVHGIDPDGLAERGNQSELGPVADDARLTPTTHYGAFKVCNELNARVYWLEHRLTSIGLRPWTVYGVGRDFGLTSEPTSAILAAAAGRPFAISYGGLQDLQYVCDVAAAFLAAVDRPFQGAEAFNVRGEVVPIERFVATLEEVVPEAKGTITHGVAPLPIAPDLDASGLARALGPLPRTSLAEGIRATYERFQRLLAEGRISA